MCRECFHTNSENASEHPSRALAISGSSAIATSLAVLTTLPRPLSCLIPLHDIHQTPWARSVALKSELLRFLVDQEFAGDD